MKKILIKTGLVFLSFSLILMLNAGAVLANGLPASAAGVAPPATGGVPAGGQLIPDTFPVNTYLKLDEQKSYVPPKTPPAEGGEAADTTPTGIVAILLRAIDLFVKLIGSIALIVFILGALLTIVSEGKEDRLEKGKTAMVYSLIGLVLTFFAFIIVAFVQSILF